ncbi:hypothetical protein MKW94_015173 [Papaver nudicaule]|uniref:Uncharacterized protein n=1 Tax=Papaver nudicaule TaxID=74823 RepID=A0AA41VKA1_PAPNU|nr:hypothetical protein [Papaver nudicaule]
MIESSTKQGARVDRYVGLWRSQLKLKGKPLDVMAGGLKKKKKQKKVQYERIAEIAAVHMTTITKRYNVFSMYISVYLPDLDVGEDVNH